MSSEKSEIKYKSGNLAVSLEEQLATAVRENNAEDVQDLLLKGADVNMPSLSGKTPLSLAATSGNIPILKALTQYTNSDKQFHSNKTQKRKSNTHASKTSSNLGYYIVIHEDDNVEESGISPTEVSSGSETLTPDDMDKLEWDCEVKEKQVESVEEIEDNACACDPSSCQEEEVWSSQYKWYAQILDKTCSAMMDSLFKTPKHVCDLDHQDTNGLTALHYATDLGHIEVVQFLINAGCRVDVGEIENLTALHLASARGRTELVSLLISAGANVNRKTSDKTSPLHYAAARGFTQTVNILISHGAVVDSLDSSERSPLYLAVSRGQLSTAQALINNGARVNIEEIHCYTPVCEGVWQKNVEMVDLLLKAGAKVTHSHNLLHYVILHRHTEMAEKLLRAGCHINKRDDAGDTPLILAARTGQVKIAEMLLKHGASPNFSNGVTGSTPLHEAIENIRDCDHTILEAMFELLVRYGANMDAVTWSSGDTPLNRALVLMWYPAVALLLRQGADPNKCDKRPVFLSYSSVYDNLGLARRRRKLGVIQMLVYAGYDLQHKTPDLTYPEDWSLVDTRTIRGWLTSVKYNPMSLLQLTRLRLRKYFGVNIGAFVHNAPLPPSVKSYLMLYDIDVNVDDTSS